MTVTIREKTEDDDLRPLQDSDPQGWEVDMWFDMAAGMPDQDMFCWVADAGDELVGYCLALPLGVAANQYGVALLHVRADHRRHGIGRAFLERVRSGLRGRVPGLMLQYVEGTADTEAAVRAWGLVETGRHQESYLDLTALDRARFEDLGRCDGVDFRPLGDLDDAAWDDLHAFTSACFLDAPDSGGDAEFIPVDAFRAALAEPWMLMTAEEGGRLLGVTFVVRRGDGSDVNTWFTGIGADARGRGLSTALKARQALGMADAGVGRLYTQNMDGNEPILRANARLGFRPGIRYVDAVEALPDAGDPGPGGGGAGLPG